jgi:nucleotide-binding universal stress UspA family protein
VDHAPCPVLIARKDRLERIVLAADGSDAAARARGMVSGHPFADRPVRVVSVAHVPAPWQGALSPLVTEAALEVWDEVLRTSREEHERVAASAAQELAAAGRAVESEVRVGDPAGEIVAVATEWDADLVAMGTHGRSGIQRILLGSVARNVIQQAPCSVLVTRADGRAQAASSAQIA